MKTIILVAGFKRAGKDTTAELIRDKLGADRVNIISFAEPMKDILCITLGITRAELDAYKNDTDRFKLIVQDQNWFNNEINDFRIILQRFGTEAMKKYFGESVWVDLALKEIAKSDKEIQVISDWRCLVEYDLISEAELNVLTTKITGGIIPDADAHSSELELIDFAFDYTLDNKEKHLDKLDRQVENLLVDEGLYFKPESETKHCNEDLHEFITNFLKLKKT